jgi:hypothetical protein
MRYYSTNITLLQVISQKISHYCGQAFCLCQRRRRIPFHMKNFYKSYPDGQTVSDRLSWSHYCELLGISDIVARGFYEKECLNAHWSVRELRRQIDSALFQRLLLSDGTLNKKKVLELAEEGQIIEKPEDIIKDPRVLLLLRFKLRDKLLA